MRAWPTRGMLLVFIGACWAPSAAGPAAGGAHGGHGGHEPMVMRGGARKLHLERGRVGGGCPASRHARCLGQMVEAFDIDAAPASPEEYQRCVDARQCPAYGAVVEGEEGTRGPGLTVEAAERYCAWRGERLPSEGEWERARLEARGFELLARPAVKEVLVGWYTWFGPEWTDRPPPQYNSWLVIRMLNGDSYRYGIHVRRATPDLAFRCVDSRSPPPQEMTAPAIAE